MTTFTFNSKNQTSDKETIPATIGEYHTYLDTGMIPWDIKNPSRKAKDILKLLGLSKLGRELQAKVNRGKTSKKD